MADLNASCFFFALCVFTSNYFEKKTLNLTVIHSNFFESSWRLAMIRYVV